MADRILIRQDTASNWSSNNPVLAEGEQGWESDTNKMKIGDGSTVWNSLDYFHTQDYLSSDPQLNDIAGLTPTDGHFIVGDGSNFVTETGATAKTSLGLTVGTDVLAHDANLKSFVDTFTLPTSDGTSGQRLVTDGSGTFSFADAGGGSSFEATASGSIANGDPLKVNSDGTVSKAVLEYDYTNVSSSGSVSGYTPVTNNQLGKSIAMSDSYALLTNNGGTNNNKAYLMNADGSLERTYTNPSGSNTWGRHSYLGTGGTDMTDDYVIIGEDDVAAYVFSTSSNTAVHTITGTSGQFAGRVAINDTHFAVAAYQGSLSGNPSYSGYVKIYSLSTGSLVQSLGSSTASEEFGMSIAMNNDRLIVGSGNGKVHVIRTSDWATITTISSWSSTAGRSNLIGIGDSYFAVGADDDGVRVYNNSNGSLVRTISAPSDGGDDFASVVKITGNVLIATVESAGTGFGQSSYTGRVYFYDIDDGSLLDTLTGPSGQTAFGSNVGVNSSGVVFIGAKGYDDGSSNNTGKVYRYQAPSSGGGAYVGIADAAYSNGDTVVVQTVGSVDDAQSGLTAGQKYYLQTDGTLATTADSPSVVAGYAVSSTELLIV